MNKLKLAVVASAIMVCHPAFCGDATLNFTGTIILPTCTVDPSSQSQNIPLGTAKTVDFSAVNDTRNATPFNVKLTSCATGTNINMVVNGTMDTVSSVLKNTGSAQQVGVQLLKATNVGDTTGSPLALNASPISLGSADASGNLTIPMVGQFYRLGTMTGGDVQATATVNFTYN